MEKLQRLPFKARNAVFQRLEQIVDIAAMSKEDRMKYDESIKVYRDKLAVTAYAEEKGRAEGLAEGMEKGLEKGMEKGQEEERLKNARGMKAAGIATDLIAQITGLSSEAVEQLT